MPRFLESFKNKDFSCLWLAQIISQFGDRINQMALIGLIASRTPGSAFDLAKVMSFTIIPVFVIGPIAGVYVDRWDRRRTLFVCDFLRGILILLIPFVFIPKNSMILIYLAVFLAFCLSRFYVPAKMSIIPDIVKEEDLLIANSLVSVTGMIAFVLGCALGGYIVEKFGARGGFIWDAVTFFISGLLVFNIRPKFSWRFNRKRFLVTGRVLIKKIRHSVIGEVKEGISYLGKHPDIRFIMNMLFILFAAAGAVYVVIIVFVQEAFNSVVRDLAVLAVVLGLGLFSGAILYGRFGEKASKFQTIFVCLVIGGLMLASFAVIIQHTHNILTAIGMSFLLGLIVGPIVIAANTVIHEVSHSEMRGKVFSSIEIVIHFAFLVAMLLSSFLSKFVPPFTILVSVGGIFAVVGLVGLVRFNSK